MSGDNTTHGYFYKPDYGVKGPTEYSRFNAALDTTDTFLNSVSGVSTLVSNWAIEDQIVTMIPVTCTYSDNNTFTLTGNYTSRFTAGAVVQVQVAAGMVYSTVASSSYAAPTTTVNLSDTVLTDPITRVFVVATRDGLWPNGPGYVVALDYGTDRAALETADAVAAGAGKELRITAAFPVDDDVTLTAPKVTIQPGVSFAISTTKTLTINGAIDAGLYQIFNCTGSGKVAGLKTAHPEWWGGIGNGATDCTAALNATSEACLAGGVVKLNPGTYMTDGWLVSNSISIVSDSISSAAADTGTTIMASGDQTYVLKMLGTYAADGSTFLRVIMRDVNINGGSHAISDAAFIMENCHISHLDRCSFQSVDGHGVRLRTVWTTWFNDYYIYDCGVLDTGSAFFIDGPTPLDYGRNTSDLHLKGGTWSSNRGKWLEISSLAAIDPFWFEGNKLEMDDITILNTVNTNVIHIGAMSRGWIKDNSFSSFGDSYGKYANLIWIGGGNDDGNNGAPGNCSNVVRGNRYYGQAGSGAINGLSLGAHAPTCIEGENTAVMNSSLTCPNVNVSAYPQIINRTWQNFSTSLFPLNLLPDRELPGFLSIHRLSRGLYARPFVADADCVNNSQTVLSLTPDDIGVPPLIFSLLDLSRYVGHSATNLLVRMRVRLSAAGSVTLSANINGTWAPVDVAGITSTSWTWVTFTIPVATITQTYHLLNMYFMSIETGTPNLLVDGVEFDVS